MNAPTLSRIWPHSGLVVGLEDHPLGSVVQAGFEKQREPADRNVLPFGADLVVAPQGARAPDDVAIDREVPEQLMAWMLNVPF